MLKVTYILCFFYAISPLAADHKAIRITGSAVGFPFIAIAAEQFKKTTNEPAPIVESTGTGRGFQMLSQKTTKNSPDLVVASRKISPVELEIYKKNINKIPPFEIVLGYDGIVIGQNAKVDALNLTLDQLYLALAKYVPHNNMFIKNPYKSWHEIDKQLPKRKILLYGPSSTSGTRHSFMELVMDTAIERHPQFKQLPSLQCKTICRTIREDGAYVEVGDNNNLIIQKLKNNLSAIGVLGFTYLEQNRDIINPISIEKTLPTFKTISNKTYPLTRPLYLYAANPQGEMVMKFLVSLTNETAWGENGYLTYKGLIPPTLQVRNKIRKQIMSYTP